MDAQEPRIIIKTITGTMCGVTYAFTPVPMSIIDTEDWVQFQGECVNAYLDNGEAERLTSFMRQNDTDAVTDGKHFYTITESRQLSFCYPQLSFCYPQPFMKKLQEGKKMPAIFNKDFDPLGQEFSF